MARIRTYTEEQKEARRVRERTRYNDSKDTMKGYHRDRTKRYREKLKLEVISAYGGVCTCCGEDHPEFLSVDHVNNDGKQHRLEALGGTLGVYRDVRDEGFPDKYTILCFNCNMARSLFGVCPHQKYVAVTRAKQQLIEVVVGM